MADDKQLLELAAFAVGGLEEIMDLGFGGGWIHVDDQGNRGSWWNPLEKTRNGLADCLQMEIDLELAVEKIGDGWFVYKNRKYLSSDKDRQRASTRAAAKIGKQKSTAR